MFRLITYTDPSGIQRHVYVQIIPGEGSVAQAINKLTQSGIPQESITERGSFASVGDITGDSRFSGAQDINSISTPDTGTGGTGPLGDIVPSDDRSFLEAFQPGAAFRSALQGTNRDVTTSPFGRTISALQPFFQSAFLGDVASRGAEGVGRGVEGGALGDTLRGPFEQFVNQTGLGGLGRLGAQAFEALSAPGTPGEIPAGVAALRRSFTNPQSQAERERAANLGLLGSAQKFSPFAAFNLLPSGGEIARQAETAQFRDPGQDFLSFLRPSVGF